MNTEKLSSENENGNNANTVLGTVVYEYEYLFRSDEGEPCPIDGWFPIATNRIRQPERIQEYIDKGVLRRIAQ